MCKHERVSITEYATASTQHDRESDGVWTHSSALGDYTGKIFVHCYDCDLKKTYTKSRPGWIKKRLEETGL
jgi:hypothetical protein